MAQHSSLVLAVPRLSDRVTVVIATQDRSSSLRHTLTRLGGLDDPPRIVVVDDASSDGTTEVVTREFAR